jgi:hypothetical protein
MNARISQSTLDVTEDMPQSTSAPEQTVTTSSPVPEIDWESPAGGEPVRPRLCLPRYVFQGGGDAHCIGQPCEVLDDGPDRNLSVAVLACGCREHVQRSALKVAETKG